MISLLFISFLCPRYFVVVAESAYPVNSLLDSSLFFPFGGNTSSVRMFSSLTNIGNQILLFGGYSDGGDFHNDISIFDLTASRWSGTISREVCCNSAGNPVNLIGSDDIVPLSNERIGFQGDLPLGRGEHGASASLGYLFVFGGNSRFGLMNDLYKFDPVELKWISINDAMGSIPVRRAGHLMISQNELIYIFGGRASIANRVVGMYDTWEYSVRLNKFSQLIPTSSNIPSGRQYAAGCVAYDRLWVYGGMDPSSNLIYDDLWSFHLESYEWVRLSTDSTSFTSYSPPPMYNAHLVPILTKDSQKLTLLLYGGMGSGGSCSSSACNSLESTFGQAYQVDVIFGNWSSEHLYKDGIKSNYELNVKWKEARISTIDNNGIIAKRIFLESVVYIPERSILFEFGGIEVISDHVKRDSQFASIMNSDFALGLDSGGSYFDDLSKIRINMKLFTNAFVNISLPLIYGTPNINLTEVNYISNVRIYKVTESDIILMNIY